MGLEAAALFDPLFGDGAFDAVEPVVERGVRSRPGNEQDNGRQPPGRPRKSADGNRDRRRYRSVSTAPGRARGRPASAAPPGSRSPASPARPGERRPPGPAVSPGHDPGQPVRPSPCCGDTPRPHRRACAASRWSRRSSASRSIRCRRARPEGGRPGAGRDAAHHPSPGVPAAKRRADRACPASPDPASRGSGCPSGSATWRTTSRRSNAPARPKVHADGPGTTGSA